MEDLLEVQDNPDKTEKEFNSTIKKLVVILGSEKALKPSKRVKFDDLSVIVKELLQEDQDKNAKEISEQLKALLKGYTELKVEVSKKEKELKQLEETKMKEFNKAARSLFERVEELDKKAGE